MTSFFESMMTELSFVGELYL